jgi:hypothetical protein
MTQHEHDEKRPGREQDEPHVRPMDDPTRGRQGDKLERELPHPPRDEHDRGKRDR